MTRQMRRLRSVSREARACAALALLLLGGACAGDGETQRLPLPDPAELVERAGITRPAWVVTSGFEAAVSDVGAGRFLAWLSPRSFAKGARARLSLVHDDALSRLTGSRVGACEVAWQEAEAAKRWQPCEIEIGRSSSRMYLSVEIESPPGSELLLASPVFEASASRAARPPVFLIVIDTARADAYRSFDPDSVIGEHLTALERDGIRFTRARSPSGWTRTAIASLFTGQSPFAHRVLGRHDVLREDAATLPELLRHAGYVTLGWSTNPNVLRRWGFARGFDAFADVGTLTWALVKPDGDEVIDRVQSVIEASGTAGRFFYVHLMDPHQPYKPDPESLAELDRLTNAHYELPGSVPRPARVREMQDKLRRYLAEAYESDAQVGRLLALLRERGEYDGALVAVVSDHGEEFLDHGGSGHGKTLYEEMLRVPVWLKLPNGSRAGTRVDRAVGLADLGVTILTALGLDAPPHAEGRDLLAETLPATPQLARLQLEDVDQGSVVHDGWKLILDFGRDRVSLYHLDEDPAERNDLAAAHPGRVAALRALFDNRRFEHERGWHVRACGGAKDGGLAFRLLLDPADLPLRDRMFEPEDAVARSAAGVDVTLALPRLAVSPDRIFARRKHTRPDEDELLIVPPPRAPASRIELQSASGAPLLYALGDSDVLERAQTLVATEREALARVPAGRPVRCADSELPHLRIWRVAAPEGPAQEVDPALVERLRALGYGD